MAQISYIKYRDILEARRYDAEYFKPEYLVFNNAKGIKFESLNTIAKVSDGDHAKFPDNQKLEVRYLRAKDIKGNFLLNDDPVFVSKDYFLKQKRSHIKGLNILMSIMGSIGDITITPENFETCLANRAICIIKDIKVNPYYLFAYMTSSIADKNIQRIKKGGIQERINLELLNEIRIPLLPQSFQLHIEEIVKSAHQKQTQSKQLYQEAEALLLAELGLLNYQVKHELTFSAEKSKVSEACRFDAEYFQPKYAEIIKKIENYEGGWDTLKNLTTFINNGNQPPYVENGEIRFFSQKWIKDQGIDYSFLESHDELMVSRDFFEDPKNKSSLIHQGDILYYSVGANLGFCHNYLEEEPIAVGSFINIIRADKTKVNELYLGFVINSIIGRMQGDREKSGVAQPYIYAKNLRTFKIPLIKPEIQKQIAEKIQESHKLRKESKELLEEAKRKVEEEIEKE